MCGHAFIEIEAKVIGTVNVAHGRGIAPCAARAAPRGGFIHVDAVPL